LFGLRLAQRPVAHFREVLGGVNERQLRPRRRLGSTNHDVGTLRKTLGDQAVLGGGKDVQAQINLIALRIDGQHELRTMN
jgi:hypothetical protein